MPTEAKKEMVASLAEMIKKSQGIIIAEYRGLTASKTQEVRRKVRAASGEIKITKNTLMRLALKECGLPTADAIDTGPNAYVMAYDDVAAVAKALRDFAKEKGNEAVIIKGGLLGNKLLSKAEVMALADLPPRQVLLGQVVGTLVAPIRGLVTVLSGPARGLVTCLSQLEEKKKNVA